MRYIPIQDLRPNSEWISSAAAAAAAVREAQPGTRSEVINHNQAVWKGLKDDLWGLSHGKCWYCESIDPRSDNAVDHYRPKGNVKDADPPHAGYWWLAFDWKNYRYSCTYCNSIRKSAWTTGGKQDYFPLWDETARARSDSDSLDDELPLLLDPTRVTDVRLIAFAEDGSVGPATNDTKGREYKRAEESAVRYHLKHPTIVDRRIIRLSTVRRWLEDADKYLDRYVKTDEPFALSAAEGRMKDIRDAASPHAEYSAAVKHLLAGMVHSEAAKNVLDSL